MNYSRAQAVVASALTGCSRSLGGIAGPTLDGLRGAAARGGSEEDRCVLYYTATRHCRICHLPPGPSGCNVLRPTVYTAHPLATRARSISMLADALALSALATRLRWPSTSLTFNRHDYAAPRAERRSWPPSERLGYFEDTCGRGLGRPRSSRSRPSRSRDRPNDRASLRDRACLPAACDVYFRVARLSGLRQLSAATATSRRLAIPRGGLGGGTRRTLATSRSGIRPRRQEHACGTRWAAGGRAALECSAMAG